MLALLVANRTATNVGRGRGRETENTECEMAAGSAETDVLPRYVPSGPPAMIDTDLRHERAKIAKLNSTAKRFTHSLKKLHVYL